MTDAVPRACQRLQSEIWVSDSVLKLSILLPKSFKKHFPDSVDKQTKLHCCFTLLIPPSAFTLISAWKCLCKMNAAVQEGPGCTSGEFLTASCPGRRMLGCSAAGCWGSQQFGNSRATFLAVYSSAGVTLCSLAKLALRFWALEFPVQKALALAGLLCFCKTGKFCKESQSSAQSRPFCFIRVYSLPQSTVKLNSV